MRGSTVSSSSESSSASWSSPEGQRNPTWPSPTGPPRQRPESHTNQNRLTQPFRVFNLPLRLLNRHAPPHQPRSSSHYDSSTDQRSLQHAPISNLRSLSQHAILDRAVFPNLCALEKVRPDDGAVVPDVDIGSEDGMSDRGLGTDGRAVAEKGGRGNGACS